MSRRIMAESKEKIVVEGVCCCFALGRVGCQGHVRCKAFTASEALFTCASFFFFLRILLVLLLISRAPVAARVCQRTASTTHVLRTK